ncbi:MULTISPECIES: GNAT family N-acetyltransferase [Methylobacterium]|uniref:GNAT family N-acetyltransferase n=1 Tax=Methylobacterium TaxID=407 RepID=UPI0013ED3639|nr:GNAT family N-acetyltransferase [Methylobacterium sp. DB0501]NGM35419.1 GNAT family N-acetyltransferase [Methylobacterium sp. DB0501]
MRIATDADAALLARLHTASWRSAYGAILEPGFLSGPIEQERLEVWTSRIGRPHPDQTAIIAESADEALGFVCAIGAEDERWGTLVDNLHVLPMAKRRGLGTALLAAAADWSLAAYPGSGLYLWCFEQNEPARRFYERRGGMAVERSRHAIPGGGDRPVIRYHWDDPASAFGLRRPADRL